MIIDDRSHDTSTSLNTVRVYTPLLHIANRPVSSQRHRNSPWASYTDVNTSNNTLPTTYLPMNYSFTQLIQPLTCASKTSQEPTKAMPLSLPNPPRTNQPKKKEPRTTTPKTEPSNVHHDNPPPPHLPAPNSRHRRSP